VLEGIERRFSGGWWNPYPPFHFYVMAAAYAPVRLLSREPAAVSDASSTYARLFVTGRLLSVLMGTGILLLLYACGREVLDARAGAGAALIAGMSVTFVYYSKFANFDVPYAFWFVLALLLFLRVLGAHRLRDWLGFSAASMLSICTKDQAYALFVLAWPYLVLSLWRWRREHAESASVADLGLDRRLLGAMALSVLLFVAIQNLPWNWAGFSAHVENITGPLGQDFRMFEKDAAGQSGLLKLSVRNVIFALGEPAALVCFGGLLLAALRGQRNARLLATLVPAVSYHLFFSSVVLYSYDRFVLPLCLVLSLFGGSLLSELARSGAGGRAARTAAVALILAYGLLRGLGLDLLIANDSRYAVEEWLNRNVDRRARIAVLGPLEYLPRLTGFNWKQRTELVRAVEHMHPDYVVVNADFARRAEDPRAREVYARLESGELGYALALAHRTTLAWPFRLDAYLREREGVIHSNLEKINPEIKVFRRVGEKP
jgi:4-amino-4-deoxy-L-arabinose transferase-like glycosyltransferase